MTLLKYNAAGEMLQSEPGFAPQAVVCSVAKSTNQAPGSNQHVKVTFDLRAIDPYGYWDTLNNRFTPKVPGYYRVTAQLYSYPPGGSIASVSCWKNGAMWKVLNGVNNVLTGANDYNMPSGTGIVYLNGTTDYVEIFGHLAGPGSAAWQGNALSGGGPYTWAEFELVAASVGVAPEPWHYVGAAGEPAFVNGWSNHGLPLRFMKDPHGFVKINGRVQGTGAGTTAFTFPAGYRPQTNQQPIFPIAYWTGSARAIGLVIIGFDGTVQISGNADNLIAMTYTSLDVVHFRAEQ